jgi:predicted nucleotidyltransferase
MKIMCMPDGICAKREEIYAVARARKAEKLWVFGSCARKEEQ